MDDLLGHITVPNDIDDFENDSPVGAGDGPDTPTLEASEVPQQTFTA